MFPKLQYYFVRTQNNSYDNLENILPLTKRPQLVNNSSGKLGSGYLYYKYK